MPQFRRCMGQNQRFFFRHLVPEEQFPLKLHPNPRWKGETLSWFVQKLSEKQSVLSVAYRKNYCGVTRKEKMKNRPKYLFLSATVYLCYFTIHRRRFWKSLNNEILGDQINIVHDTILLKWIHCYSIDMWKSSSPPAHVSAGCPTALPM